ncbi:MAG TPA: FAD-binding oxidoreductase [Candidatus Acidoferrum sp.]|nr:FAD-binding oxidoreductase [Candidatus Acidoferrum sp.]
MKVAADVAGRLVEAIGAKRVVAAEEELATYAIDGLVPSAIVRPASVEEVAEVVRLAVKDKLAVVPVGARSKCELGMAPQQYDIAIDMTGLRGIAHYDAGDLTLSVDAGIPLRELEIYLKEKGQFLPLAVPCFESATAGGTIASGIDSALRLQYGSPRDFLIGAEFVDGTGQLCRSGGRVVKNVTGYDLHKLLIGSLGTIGVITRVNFRTFPLPTTFGGHLAGFANSREALEYRSAVEKAGLPVANLEVLSPSVAGMIRAILQKSEEPLPPELERADWSVYSSFEGNEEVVRRIALDLDTIAREACSAQSRILQPAEDEALGGMLRECFEWLRWASPANVICRLVLPEIKTGFLTGLLQLAESVAPRSALLVRAAGIVYFAVFAEENDEVAIASLAKAVSRVNALARAGNGHTTLLRAPTAIKSQAGEMAGEHIDRGMQLRVKQAFDPAGVFVPGRIVGGI